MPSVIRLLLAGWIAALAVAAHAAAPVWINWSAGDDGKTHTYAAGGYKLTLTLKPATKAEPSVPVLTIAAPGLRSLTLPGVGGPLGNGVALVGVVQLDPKAARPAVLLQTFSGGAHCCTTLDLAIPASAGWRTYELTFDGDTSQEIVDSGYGAPPVLLIGDSAFDYAFASHAGSYLLKRAYAVQGGRLVDVSGEARLAGLRRDAMNATLGRCQAKSADRNGECAAYVAAASLIGQHDAAWKRMLALYDVTGDVWPNGCRVDDHAGCPKRDVLAFKSFPAALAWFLWRYGYAPPAPSFACPAVNCPVAWPKSPMPRAAVGGR